MNNSIETKSPMLYLDFNQKSYKTVLAKEYDQGSRFVPIQCTLNGQKYSVDSSAYVEVRVLTPDDRALSDIVAVQSDGTLLLELTETMLWYPGKANVEIVIYDTSEKNKRLSTMCFNLIIEAAVYSEDRVVATDEFNALTELINKVTKDYDYVITECNKSASNAKTSETNAKTYMNNASSSATSANTSAKTATTKASEASTSASNAKTSETNAKTSETNAKTSETNASNSATTSQNYAIGNTNSAKYYYEQAKMISESFSGALKPMGTVTFTNLPPLSEASDGDMYNISDQFTTTDDFREGSGFVIPIGSNVYKTSDGKWDVLAGTPVTGVKGNSESSYRTGNINLTANDIGAATSSHTHSNATTSSDGFMSKELVQKLSGISEGADAVSFSQNLTSGTVVGTITINGTDVKLYCQTNTDTKNTAGSSDTSSKIFLIGSTSQTANSQTYSQDTVYVGTDGCLYSNSTRLLSEIIQSSEPESQIDNDYWLQDY